MTKARLGFIFAGGVLKNLKRLKLTQQQVADRVSTSLRWIQKIESGRKLPGFFLAIKLILSLGIDMNALLLQLESDDQPRNAASNDPASTR